MLFFDTKTMTHLGKIKSILRITVTILHTLIFNIETYIEVYMGNDKYA